MVSSEEEEYDVALEKHAWPQVATGRFSPLGVGVKSMYCSGIRPLTLVSIASMASNETRLNHMAHVLLLTGTKGLSSPVLFSVD